jgi:hypothetical protein
MIPNPVERAAPRSLASRWPVDWSAVWVGALSAVVLTLIIALIGVAVGAHRAADARIVRWSEFGLWSLIFTVGGAFLSFVVGGWVAGRIAGFFRAEPAILHGAIAWLLGVSLIMAMGSRVRAVVSRIHPAPCRGGADRRRRPRHGPGGTERRFDGSACAGRPRLRRTPPWPGIPLAPERGEERLRS